MGKDDKRVIDIFVDAVGDKNVILSLLQLPDFDPKKFLFFSSWFLQRETDTAQLKDKKKMMDRFIDLYSLFPYSEGLRDWFESNLTNDQIVQYRGDGIDLDTAIQLIGK